MVFAMLEIIATPTRASVISKGGTIDRSAQTRTPSLRIAAAVRAVKTRESARRAIGIKQSPGRASVGAGSEGDGIEISKGHQFLDYS